MKINFLPRTKLGRYSVIIMALTLIFFIVGSLMSWDFSYYGFKFIAKNQIHIAVLFIIFILGVLACALGFMAIDKKRDKSILVLISIILGINNIVGFFSFIAHIFI